MTGGWKAAFLVDPAKPLHTADPAHAVTAAEGGDPNPVWVDPATAPDGPPGYLADYVGNEYYPYYAPGAWYDQTNYHDGNDGYAGAADPNETEAQNRAEAGAAHAQSEGADVQSNMGNAYTLRPVQQADERYIMTRFESDRAVQLNPNVAVRGFNGQAANSDEALIRPGLVEQFMVDRKLMGNPQREHTDRWNLPNTAVAPANTAPNPSPYGNPFSALARAMTRTWSSPMVRRDPPPIDEQIVTDGTDPGQQYASVVGSEWVIG